MLLCAIQSVEEMLTLFSGYLLSQFLSPSTNHRTDSYGGPLSARSRLIFEVAKAIQARVSPTFSLSIKLNCVEFQDDGFHLSDCTALCAALETHRFDFVELSGGTYEKLGFSHERESTRRREAFFLDFAEAIVPSLNKTKVFITGGFRTVGGMVNALKTVDGIGMVRALCQEPNFCRDVLEGKVKGVMKQTIDTDAIIYTSMAAGAQLDMISRGLEPLNLGDESEVDLLKKGLGEWIEDLKQDSSHEKSGWPQFGNTNTAHKTSCA